MREPSTEKEGGAFPDPIRQPHIGPTRTPVEPDAGGARQGDSTVYALADLNDPADATKVLVAAGKQVVNGFCATARRRFDRWPAAGSIRAAINEGGQQHGPALDNVDPGEAGIAFLNWSFAWPAQPAHRSTTAPRADLERKTVGPEKPQDPRMGRGQQWTGFDVPDIRAQRQAGRHVRRSVHHEPRKGVARLFVARPAARRAVPGPLRALRGADRQRGQRRRSGATRWRASSRTIVEAVRQRRTSFPIAATSYRLTEHFHYWTKHNRVNAVAAAAAILCRDVRSNSRKEKGDPRPAAGFAYGRKRGSVKAKAVVTKRIKSADLRRQDGACGRHSATLGVHGLCPEGLGAELADPLRSVMPISRRPSSRRSSSMSSRSTAPGADA